MIKILIVDDQQAVRERLKMALESQTDFQVIGTAANGEDAIDLTALLQPDLVLLDIEMPGMSGLEVAGTIRDRFPQTRTIMLSSCDDADAIRASLQNGVNGYVVKQKLDASMVEIIRSVHRGHSQFGPGLLEKVITQTSALAMVSPPPASAPLQAPADRSTEQLEVAQPSGELIPAESVALVEEEPEPVELADRFQENARTKLTDWSNAAKEIIDGVPLPWTRGLFYFLLAFMGVAIPWAIFFQMDEIGTARGRLELTGDTVKREADLPGNATVKKVLVKKGDFVTKGQVIMELDAKEISDQIQQNQVKLEGQQQRLNQLNLSKNQLMIALTTQQQQNQAQLGEKQTQIAQAEQNLTGLKTSYNNQTSEKSAQVDQAAQTVRDRQSNLSQQQQEKANQVAQARQTIIDSTAAYKLAESRALDAQREVARYDKLLKQGAIPEIRSREAQSTAKERGQTTAQSQASLQQAKLRLKEQQDSYRKAMQQAEAEIKQAQLRLKEQQGSYQRTLGQIQSDIAQAQLRLAEQQSGLNSLIQSNKLALVKSEQQVKEVQGQITTLENEILQNKQSGQVLTEQLQKYTIKADVDGNIFELPVTREGAVMQPKQLIAEIAPASKEGKTDLVFKGEIPAAESESLRAQGVGKEVKLKFDEFPFATYGIVKGKLIWVAPNSKVNATATGSTNASYEVKVALDKPCLTYQQQCLSFKSGQPATAEIVIRRRRILDLIADPFTKLRG
jgi:hemolysin D